MIINGITILKSFLSSISGLQLKHFYISFVHYQVYVYISYMIFLFFLIASHWDFNSEPFQCFGLQPSILYVFLSIFFLTFFVFNDLIVHFTFTNFSQDLVYIVYTKFREFILLILLLLPFSEIALTFGKSFDLSTKCVL